ncbi:HAD family hydrolase [Corynebacterium silvaticum]|uniref:Uncharacterized protein n=1 Tax=Corynebacterium silvaticum TaxID=2320431 RepID=A0A7Y4P9X2_9CORY|nr:HAD family hydrolase [Corynebacterium silvaticum]ARU45244.1 hypothetical protein CBE74_00515 [Corynebacterium silvaticum]MBH5301073.1 hypothetical protein [Corynebacterium silvaticum]NOM65273.1 hypothetical protein [Corynebacterium silvaticum]NON70910.1 hypothetical protein [Corynebacterium silvaticum]TFA92717.1 hypothetical protein EU802_05040 [Corynebacterium silvaticum]
MATFLFDLYGVLLKLPTQEEIDHLGATIGADDRFCPTFHKLRPSFDENRVNAENFWRQMKVALGLDDIDWAEAHQMDLEMSMGVDAEMVRWALDLKDQGHRIGILSNIPLDFARRLRREQPWMEDFDAVFLSGEVGVAKPSARAFDIACQRLGLCRGTRCLLKIRAPILKRGRCMA